MLKKINKLPLLAFVLSFALLSIIQLKVKNPMLIFERFYAGTGWIEILILSGFAAFLMNKMLDKTQTEKWRNRTWLLFSIVFFSQLALGLMGFDKFLMTGNLHLPIPAMILAGPIYRFEISFMPILFLSTIILTGPAWCSQLCYFGAIDSAFANKNKTNKFSFKNMMLYKNIFLIVFILLVFSIRIFEVSLENSVKFALIFAIIGISIMIAFSSQKGKMLHCIAYCPIGTLVNYLKFINPMHMYIDDECSNCMRCTKHCKYNALTKQDIENRKPALTCTLCGDCVTACHSNSIKYKLFKLSPETSRNIYLLITIVVYVVFLGVARI
jgi:polyferredoxin